MSNITKDKCPVCGSTNCNGVPTYGFDCPINNDK